ncbi:hypothetical protein [Natronoarchaeum rubrum]|uniref:hypothetical protein n=1 Tax=Natronoarchaeum rubrum TaxID=755311 RepID=UPI0021127EA3|nr:hypothetical protein [Natronoarchaeum rubrum]
MDSTDDTTENGSSTTDSEEDLPTEVPEDSVLYNDEEGDEASEARDDGGSSISRRAALGGLGVGALAVGGGLVFSGALGGSSDDGSGDDPESSTPASDEQSTDEGNGDEGSSEEGAESRDPAMTFDNQAFKGNGVNISATTPGEYAVLVTYGEDGDSVVAGTAEANDLDDEAVAVRFEETSGIPGTHTAHLVEGDTSGYEAGDALTAETIGNAVVSDAAFVSGEGDDAETGVTFADQALENGGVSMELTTPDDHFVILTYDHDGQPIVAGGDDTSNLDAETRAVDIVDRDGVPGEHTAHLLANADGSQFYVPGDELSEATADVVTASATATVSEPAVDPAVAISFEDQSLDDGSVTLTATAPDAHFVLVTYRSGDDRIVAGADTVSGLDGESVTVDLDDDGGVGGLHTAYVVANDDGSQVYQAGDVASQSTVGAAKVASTADVSE